MYKKIFIILISLVISISIIGCSNQTSRTTKSSTTTSSTTSTSSTISTSTSTSTGQTGTTALLVVGTILEANTTLTDYLADLAQSEKAKAILTDFYTYFLQTETYIWDDSTIIEMESDSQILWRDFEVWEIAYFVSAKSWDLFPDLFNGIFTFEQELVHPTSDGNTASYQYTMALRWRIDPRSGEVTAYNGNAERFEAELVK